MLQPGSPSAPGSRSASPSPGSPAPAESIQYPDAGLAHGRWEAPPWAFVLVAALVVIGSLVWLALVLRARRIGS